MSCAVFSCYTILAIIVSTMSCLSLLQKESTCFLWIGPVPASDYQPTESFLLTNLYQYHIVTYVNLMLILCESYLIFNFDGFCFFLGAQVQSSSGGWKWISTAAMGGFNRMASCKLGLAMTILAMFFFPLGLIFMLFWLLCAFCWRCSVLHVWTLGLRNFGYTADTQDSAIFPLFFKSRFSECYPSLTGTHFLTSSHVWQVFNTWMFWS